MKPIIIFLLLFSPIFLRAQAPNWQWARALHTHYNGSGNIITDKSSVYVCGSFSDTLSMGTFAVRSVGGYDIYIAVYDTVGTLQQLKSYGGPGDDSYERIAINNDGRLFLTGAFHDSAVICGKHIASRGGNDIMLIDFENLDSLQWVKTMGGEWDDIPTDLLFDNRGNLYLSGDYAIYSGSPEVGGYAIFDADTLTAAGQGGGFIAKYNSAETLVKTATDSGVGNWGGAGFASISLDPNYNINTTGLLAAKSWYGDILLTTPTYGVSTVQYNSALEPQWGHATTEGSPTVLDFTEENTGGTGIKTDRKGNSYIIGENYNCGMFFGTTFLSFGTSWDSQMDGFVAKYASDGTFLWAKVIGSSENPVEVNAIDIDSSGNIFIAGDFYYTFFDSIDTLISNAGSDIFVAELDYDGNYKWVKSAGGNGNDEAYAISVDEEGRNIFLAGRFNSPTLIIGNDSLKSTATMLGEYDAFTAKLRNELPLSISKNPAKPVMSISPNPANTFCTVQLGDNSFSSLSIEDMNGRVWRTVSILAGKRSITIDVSQLSTGLYLLKATNDNGNVVQKLSVVH